ncbi:MAG: asparagine--tRNA ligase [Candidatus Heimdallarchaeota archaeon]|nr:asparagine--tRNA ligase [Candidatus Heimdallarchaeota archaeon]
MSKGFTMQFFNIRELLTGKHVDEEVNLRGWVARKRSGKNLAFLTLRDSTGRMQVSIKRKQAEEAYEKATDVGYEAAVIVKGKLVKDERAPDGYEIRASDLQIIGKADNFPITKDFSQEFLLDVRHLALRTEKMTAMLKIRSSIVEAIHQYLRGEGYIEVQPPIFTTAGSEGGSTLFEVDYFGDKIFLSQSWQLYAENFIYAVEKAYTIAPSFRAEKSKSARHVTEFWHAEMEAAWLEFEGLLQAMEEIITTICQNVVKNNKFELEILGQKPEDLLKIKPPFPRITYDETLKLLKENGMEVPYGQDLGQHEEREIGKLFKKPVLITHYPREIMAFYKKVDPKNSKVCLNANLIVPDVGEIIDGSERESDIDEILKSLEHEGTDPADVDFYLDTRRYGSVPHSGFGLGIDRVVMWICGFDTIKDAIAFPRTMTRIKP